MDSDMHDEDTMESSLSDPSASSQCDETIYTILAGGSIKGTDKLFDNNGYSYTLGRTNVGGSQLWRCRVLTRRCTCPSTVLQHVDGTFVKLGTHNHPEKLGALEAAMIAKITKDEAVKDPLKSAPLIAQEVIKRILSNEQPCGALAIQPLLYLARNANHARQQLRLKEPRTLDFTIHEEHVQNDFLKADVYNEEARHLMFATTPQLDLLRKAKVWYMDATYKVMKKPFCQLFSIHAFVRKGDDEKQVPLLFCIMSRRRASDYITVFNQINSLIGSTRVKKIVIDFEEALWKSLKDAYPTAKVKGCSFHFKQAVYRKIENLSLQKKYRHCDPHHAILKKTMALCYLPKVCIKPAFEKLRRKTTDETMIKLMDYMAETWIYNKTWRPSAWSVYKMAIRTNNDVEGWHNRLNGWGHPGMSFYRLLGLLYREATYCESQTRLVSLKKLKKRRRKESAEEDARLYKLWRKYKRGEKTSDQLLSKIARVIARVKS